MKTTLSNEEFKKVLRSGSIYEGFINEKKLAETYTTLHFTYKNPDGTVATLNFDSISFSINVNPKVEEKKKNLIKQGVGKNNVKSLL